MTQGDATKNMELSNGGRLPQPPPHRPSIQTHHSSSVPSTPYQQPRDLRFHSRSPSPSRALANQSPRSVVSEAVGRSVPQRNTPVVCKFESGAEIRKRRIPYVDGGNEELGPPKKEPKRALEPDEHEKLSGDMRELYDRLLPSQESEERRTLLVKKLEKILNEEWPGNDIRVHVFGSSGNDLSSSDSDVDICITTTLKKLESMHSIATLLDKHGMQKVVCRASAKVPIVKCWDPELKLAADLNVNNTLALENTRMIKTYVQLDQRVRPLAKIIKYWTKRRILNDAAFGGTISSYTWICMIISFLQRREPPILPSLQKIADQRPGDGEVGACQFADDVESLKGTGDLNKETLAELLFQFFRQYGYEFEYWKHVVSVKEGRLLSRKEKGWDPGNWQDKEARCRLCVEEPFTVNRNLGNSADDYAWSGIHGEIRRAFDLLADGAQLEKCCEQFEFPPEEKPIFQRPAPKPKPTLTRSASQSGRPNHEGGSNRSRKNRNQSSQRSGNRRASSGAAFNNQRGVLGFPSPLGVAMMDYFAAKGDLHNHLFQQYQILQAQQEALQRQLQQSAHAQAQSQSQGRSSDASGSPMHRALSSGLPSPRLADSAPQTGPLLPGYLYHYPTRYPPPSSMAQVRSREGSSTSPSSPSMSAAQPLLRRQVHRGSLPDGSSGSFRSQSQPGRSLPHPLTLQQHAHPGYDVSGALGAQQQPVRPPHGYSQNQLGLQMPFSPLVGGYPATAPVDSALPKEYIGYYVGQSPLLGPQYVPTNQMSMAPMTLRDSPVQRPRRVTPDLMPPIPNGRHASRSPSPLGSSRSISIDDYQSPAPPAPTSTQFLQSPQSYATSVMPQLPMTAAATSSFPAQIPADGGAPLIVNGSTSSTAPQQHASMNGLPRKGSLGPEQYSTAPSDHPLSKVQSLPLRAPLDTAFDPERIDPAEKISPSPQMTPVSRLKLNSKLTLSPNGAPLNSDETADVPYHDPIPAPLLSPVAELRTPSPRHSADLDRESPKANGIIKAAKIANAKQAERNENSSAMNPPSPKHERKTSAPNPTTPAKTGAVRPSTSPTAIAAPALNATAKVNENQWQTATKKGHKKSKSSGQAKSSLGQPLPINDFERKGG